MNAVDVIDIIFKENISSFLKEKGFKKKGQNFVRQTRDCADAINLQKSQWNTAGEAQFTINLGIYWPEVQKNFGTKELLPFPSVAQCTVQERLGGLFKGNDFWWSASPRSDAKALGQEVLDTLIKYGMPWLENGHDPRVSLAYLTKNKKSNPKIEAMRFFVSQNKS
jgi:hypothetical protein